MSKSLGNFHTLRDLVGMGYTPEAIRYLLASVPYRKKLNFTFDGLKAAATSMERLRNYKLRLETAKFPDGTNAEITKRTQAATAAFDAALDDDLNTAEALGAVFEYVRDTNTAMDKGEFPAGNAAEALGFLSRFDSVFDVLNRSPRGVDISASVSLSGSLEAKLILGDASVEALIAERTAAKKSRNFSRSDEIRAQLAAQGIVLEDTKDGVRWKRP
jgi:cysteinyl-tRNA synthetase